MSVEPEQSQAGTAGGAAPSPEFVARDWLSSRLDVLITLALFVAVNVASFYFQKPLTYNQGRGWDGWVYHSVAEQFKAEKWPIGEAPFVYRIGTPLVVAAFFGDNLLTGFKVVNVCANLVTTLLFLCWLRLYLRDWRIRLLMTALFMLAWHGPVRFVYFYPALCDNGLFVFLMAGLLSIQKLRAAPGIGGFFTLAIITLAGVIVREVMIIIPLAALFVSNPLVLSRPTDTSWLFAQAERAWRRFPWWALLPLAAALLGMLCVRWVVTPHPSIPYEFFGTALWWLYNKSLLLYAQAWFVTFGPIIVAPIYFWRESWQFLARNQFQLVFLVGVAAAAWIGGTDTERFLFWSVPVVFLLVGKALENHAILSRVGLFPLVLLGTQLISQRAFWVIPDFPRPFVTPFPVLTFPTSTFQYLDLYSCHGNRSIQMLVLLEYVILVMILLVWLNLWQSRRIGRGSPIRLGR